MVGVKLNSNSIQIFSVFSLFTIVNFKNEPCVSTSQLSSGSTPYRNGTCFTSRYVPSGVYELTKYCEFQLLILNFLIANVHLMVDLLKVPAQLVLEFAVSLP